jgi:hypothetical protein
MTSTLRRCERCGCTLASDHGERRCSPCARAEVLATIPVDAVVLPRGVHVDDVAAAWARGLDHVAELVGCDRAEAARVVWRAGLVKRRTRLDEEAFVTLAIEPGTPHTTLARRLGVSRWTLASWREGLAPHLRSGERSAG